MTKILFTHSYFYRFDPKQWKAKQPYPPYGTIVAAALLRQSGYEVRLFDSNLAESPQEILPHLKKMNPSYVVIYDDGFNYLTKMCLTKMREAAFEIAAYAKDHRCTVFACSSDASDHAELYLDHSVDVVITGEGEATLRELIRHLENNNGTIETIETVDGVVFRKDRTTIRTQKRALLRDLDALPLPAWDLVDIAAYKALWQKYHHGFSLNIATTRGCPFKCNWCAKPIYGNRYTSRSPKNVVEEIEHLLRNYQPDHLWMCDDIFGLTPGWVQEFRDRVVQKKLRFKYHIQSRVDLLLHEDTIDALAESGAETVWVGAESGSQAILDAMEKGTTVGQIYTAAKLLKERHINVGLFLQFGYAGETKADIDKTIAMLLELMPDDIGVSISYPLLGTKFYETVKNDLKEKTNWTDSDDLALLFRNNFQPKYYKRLHRYVHKIYRRKQFILDLKKLLRHPLHIRRRHLRNLLSVIYYTVLLPVDAVLLKTYAAESTVKK